MASRIEDYALIGDLESCALVARDGSIDWLCMPRFDSRACFAALLGEVEHGRWLIAPMDGGRATRSYRENSLVLETEFETEGGRVRLVDFMPPRGRRPDVVRIVEGVHGRVRMTMDLVVRFDYGAIVPWAHEVEGGVIAVGGPDALHLETPVRLDTDNRYVRATFEVRAGQRIPFVLTWFPSHEQLPPQVDPDRALDDTERFWREWVGRCTYQGKWRDAVVRSLITLKALTYGPTGGIVAAATTSLPEELGGQLNWDYRFCWLRDATETLEAFLAAGYREEARAWRDWLLRALAGDPRKIQVLYGPAGEHRLPELELPWLPGYEDSRPVRVGNLATGQLQLDVYGELMDAMHQSRRAGVEGDDHAWELQRRLLEFLESGWEEPDEGIWEVRGERRHFTHSKVLTWVAFRRAVAAVEELGLDGPAHRWRSIAKRIHEEVCRRGFDPDLGSFVQFYGSKRLDASLLLIPVVGFLPGDDPMVLGTIEAVRRELGAGEGLLYRYTADVTVQGVTAQEEGAFVPCSFWLASALWLAGRREEATDVFERALDLRNDVGLLSEEYEPRTGRLLGNYPQAFSHIWLVTTAAELSQPEQRRPGRRRSAVE